MTRTGADPRFDGVADQKAVKVGAWFQLEHMGHIQFGTSDSYVENAAEGANNLLIYAQQTGSYEGDSQVVLVDFNSYGLTTATTTGGAEADVIKASINLAASITGGVSAGMFEAHVLANASKDSWGLVAGIRGYLRMDAATRTFSSGAFTAVDANLEIAAGNAGATCISLFRCSDGGAAKGHVLLDSSGVATASAGIWETTAGAVSTVLGYYRVFTAAGTGYIVVYASHAA